MARKIRVQTKIGKSIQEMLKGHTGKVTSLFEKYKFFDGQHRVRYRSMGGDVGRKVGYTDLQVFIQTPDPSVDNPAGLYFQEHDKGESKKILLNYLKRYEKRNINKNPEEAKKAQKIKSELLKILGE